MDKKWYLWALLNSLERQKFNRVHRYHFFDVFQANLLKKDDILAITPGRFAEKSRYLIENATSDMILSALTSDRRPRTQIRPKPIAKKSKKAEKGACRRPTKMHPLTNIEIAVFGGVKNYKITKKLQNAT